MNDVEELDIIRLREITGKAISGALLLLLKWFKRSRKNFGLSRDISPLLIVGRYSQIRVHDTVASGLELPSIDTEDVCSSRCR